MGQWSVPRLSVPVLGTRFSVVRPQALGLLNVRPGMLPQKNPASGEAGRLLTSHLRLEGKPRPELELARRVHRVRDLSEWGTLRRTPTKLVMVGYPHCAVVGHVIAGNIEAERFRFGQL